MVDIAGGYIINPESFWRPAYRISPFDTSFVRKNVQLAASGAIDTAVLKDHLGDNFVFCKSGKEAIALALAQYDLRADDEVWIITTSGNKYISSCVTEQIDKFCRWSRRKTGSTRLIFVNHEFGFCYPNLSGLKAHNLPIIEDRALSFNSHDPLRETGTIGDFVIYSLPKFFPINIGGVLKCNNPMLWERIVDKPSNPSLDHYLAVLLSHYLKQVEDIGLVRRFNHQYLAEQFTALGFTPRFELTTGEVPGVFMFHCPNTDLAGLKTFMQVNGIESSVFYGEEVFYIPVHQGLKQEDMDFFYNLVNYYLKNGN